MKINIFAISLLFISITLAAKADAASSIKIIGNHRIEESTIKSLLVFSAGGGNYSEENIDTSLKNLYASNLFSEVTIEKQGNILVVTVKENPKINKVIFEGNKRIKDEDLRKEVSLTERSVYTKSKLQSDINRIIEVYSQQGRYSVTVTPKLIELSQNRIDLIFEIKEGPKSVISKIIFEGNKQFSDSKLKSIIQSSESQWYSFFSSNDKYNSYRIEYDKELLSRYYKSKGYATFQVVSAIADLNEAKDKFFITFTLEEGEKYKFGETKITSSIKKISENQLHSILKIKKGTTYNLLEVEKSVEAITRFLNDQGYAFVSVEPVPSINQETKFVDINIEINEGRKAYLRQINIKGNLRTADKVIRREFKIEEGDPFNASKIFQSERKINDLDYFEKVEVNHHSTSEPDKFDIDVEVTEKSTASVNFAGGYNTSEGPIGMIILTERNLFGNGQELSAKVSKARKKLNFDISFTEPYFRDLPLAVGFDLQNSSSGRDNKYTTRSFGVKSKGAAVRAEYEIIDNLYHQGRYSLTSTHIHDVAKEVKLIKNGKTLNSAVGQRFAYDTRDAKFNPNSGIYSFVDQQYSGVGGNVKFLRHEIGSSYFVPVYGEEVILELSGSVGDIRTQGKRKISVNDKFSLGNDQMRGFEDYGIGPREKICDPDTKVCSDNNYTGNALGGNMFYMASAEFRVPITIQKDLGIYGTVFADIGEVFKTDFDGTEKSSYFHERGMRSSAGVGIGFNTPMGPIKLGYAIPIKKKKFDRTQRFFITFTATKF